MASFPEDDLLPNGSEESFFAQRQKSTRKDVEQGFGVLQARWEIVKGPAGSWYRHHIANVMYACIILHNMIIDDEGQRVDDWSDDEVGPSAGHTTSLVIRGLPYGVNERLQAGENMRNRQAHLQLMNDMVEEVWTSSIGNSAEFFAYQFLKFIAA
ncbi:uncharacterized protein LOC121810497 [Salvia splendens]|uniref:uncharacterized protein LOC121810497 n=1 Tax=Salvia splendens TaxID=180675 RepID=UPI001C27F789|nr:uncharacterized protein LOC121810497 [Salvia splendens]